MEGHSDQDLHVFREQARTFCGSFKVDLDKLQHEEPPARQPDEKNIKRMVGVYQSEGCWPLWSENHIPALISQSIRPNDTHERGIDFGYFIPREPLIYLTGYHRIEAARIFLKTSRWWIVDLYLDDISERAKDTLREREPNCRKSYDGDVLRQMRMATFRGNTARRKSCYAQLSPNKKRLINRLECQPPEVLNSFDDLLDFPGLWAVNFIGTFKRIFTLHMPEELARYLGRMKAIWTYIVGNKDEDKPLVDQNTVYVLSKLCPGLSFHDRENVQKWMANKTLFPAIKDELRRSELLHRLCSMDCVIPSFHTFVENTRRLEVGSGVLKKILSGKCVGSLSKYFAAIHNGQRIIKIQMREFEFEDRAFPSGQHALQAAYRMIWLLVLRHMDKRNASRPGIEPMWWAELTSLAVQSGYQRIFQKYGTRKAATINMIQEFVLNILSPKYYNTDYEACQRKSRLVYQVLFSNADLKTPIASTPELTTDQDNLREGLENRSTQVADESYLFFDKIYASYDKTPRKYLTPFAVARDFFLSFFGPDGYESELISPNELDATPHNMEVDQDAIPQMEMPHNMEVDQDALPQMETPHMSSNSEVRHRDAPLHQQTGTPLNSRGSTNRALMRLRSRSQSPSTPDQATSHREQSPVPVTRKRRASTSDHEDVLVKRRSPLLVTDPTATDDTSIGLAPATVALEIGPESRNIFSFEATSRLLYRRRSLTSPRSFNVIVPTGKDEFRIRRTDIADIKSIIDALQIGQSVSFMTANNNKRVKLAAPTVILLDARAKKTEAVVVASKETSHDLLRKFQNYERLEEELSHGNIGGRPIQMTIWRGRHWQVIKSKVRFNQVKDEVTDLLREHPSFRAYDWEGKLLAINECYEAAQKEVPPGIYLCSPEDASTQLPLL